MNTLTADRLQARYDGFREKGRKIDLTRGRPSVEQVALSNPMLEDTSIYSEDGVDCRNYGGSAPRSGLFGLPEARRLFGEYLGVPAENVIVGDNSSLRLMHDIISRALRHPLPGSNGWSLLGETALTPAFLCPEPGYDRHHDICTDLGIRMLPVQMTGEGPDIAHVETLVQHENVVGMWWIPKYHNPTGITSSRSVCERLAQMQTANPGFRIFADYAYHGHSLTPHDDVLPDMLALCKDAGNEDRILIFSSFSKVTFPGASITALAASKANFGWFADGLKAQTIGPDKLRQLHHVNFLSSGAGIRAHMAKHSRILAPKFDVANDVLARELGGKEIAWWRKPGGGYFFHLRLRDGLALRAHTLAADAGVLLTHPGGMFADGVDPHDSHQRLAITACSLEEVRTAVEVYAVCVQLAARN